ncbi:MAG: hypothetical protein RLZZ04_100 [Cyanobacteriota bacterium]|jgi:hypothetical protein
MSEPPKYQIGNRIPSSPFIVRGIAPQKSGEYLYFLQMQKSDNTMIATEVDIQDAIDKAYNRVSRLMRSRRQSDRNIL